MCLKQKIGISHGAAQGSKNTKAEASCHASLISSPHIGTMLLLHCLWVKVSLRARPISLWEEPPEEVNAWSVVH